MSLSRYPQAANFQNVSPESSQRGTSPSRQIAHRPLPYKYISLDETVKQIRLLTLLPGEFSDQIKLTLEAVHFTTDHIPEFEAISYAWGSEDNPVDIFIESKSSSEILARSNMSSSLYTLSVTQNLAEALPYLRYKTEPRTLWIDAICINQQDIPERSYQVKRMADIFSLAKRVVVWLGPGGRDASVAFNLMKSAGNYIEADWITGRITSRSKDMNEHHWADPSIALPYTSHEYIAVAAILERPWFQRLWIWQEIWLAGPEAVLLCGNEKILWSTFRSYIFCICRKSDVEKLPTEMAHVDLIMLYRLCEMADQRDLNYLVTTTSRSKCTDPRDRIFALQSLLDPQDPVNLLEPDYSKTVVEIYIDIFLRSSITQRWLGLFPRCELLGQKIDGIPSWLPNWTIPQQAPSLDLMRTAGNSTPVIQLVNETRLKVHGTQFAIIEHVVQCSIPKNLTAEQIIDEILGIARHLQVRSTEYESFCFTLCAGYFTNVYENRDTASSIRLELSRALMFFSSLFDNSFANIPEVSSHDFTVINHIYYSLQYRSVYRTSNGELGLAPHSAEAGDVLVAFLGCDSAMVLRPCDGDTYKVVGESYCHGYMACEAFLGPLPTTHRLVWRDSEPLDRIICPTFLDIASGIAHPEDPRLGQLPQGWVFKDHDKKHIWHAFWNEETGEETLRDPRLTLEALKARGVEVQAFDLI